MFRKKKSVNVKSSASALCNNLSIIQNNEKGITKYAVVHKSAVNLVSILADSDGIANQKQVTCKEPSAGHTHSSMILQAKFVELSQRSILVLTSQKGIQMFESDGSTMLYWHALSAGTNFQEIQPTFARGVCGLQGDMVCIGTHAGEIFVFHIPLKGTNVTTVQVLKGHSSAVCDLTSEGDRLASSDEQGNIVVWAVANGNLQQIMKINGYGGYPCSSLAIWNGIIVGGYGSGHLRMFNLSSGEMAAEVTAHARWITAIDIARDSGVCLSVGEDSFARVWQLKQGANPQISHVQSEHVNDMQLVGGCFVKDGNSFYVTGYDSNELVSFSKS